MTSGVHSGPTDDDLHPPDGLRQRAWQVAVGEAVLLQEVILLMMLSTVKVRGCPGPLTTVTTQIDPCSVTILIKTVSS